MANGELSIDQMSAIVERRQKELGIDVGRHMNVGEAARAIAESYLHVPAETPEQRAEREAREAERMAAEESRQRWNAWRGLVSDRGERYRDCSLDTFEASSPEQRAALARLREFCGDIQTRGACTESLVFFGPPGTGKDHLMMAMLREVIRLVGARVVWRNGMDLYGDVRDRMDSDKPESELIRSLAAPDVLAISDPIPPWGTLTDFQAQILFRVVDRRYSDCRPMWVTMNVASGDEASNRLSKQIAERIKHGAMLIHCDWPSYRAAKA